MNDTADKVVVNLRLNNKKISKSRSFEYKTKMIGRTLANNYTLDA